MTGSVAGIGLLTLIAAAPLSPFHPALPPGEQAIGPLRWVASAIGLDALSRDGIAGVAIVVLVFASVAFVYAVREAWRGRITVRLALTLGIAFNLLMLAVPLLLSRDVYNYAMYGRILSVHHANPYVAVPADYPADPIFELSGEKWRTIPAVYGPAFIALSAGVTKVVGSATGLILAFKLIAVAASIATMLVVARLTQKVWPKRAAFAVVMFGWNPVVLFHSVASGHNDLLVALTIAGAIALVFARRPLLAAAVLTLGALVKVTAALPLVLLVIVVVARRPPGERARILAKYVAVAAGIAIVFAVPFMQTRDPTLGQLELATHTGWLAPSRLFQRTFQHLLDVAGLHLLGVAGSVLIRIAFPLAFLVAVVAIGRMLLREEPAPVAQGAAWGWGLLFLTMTGPVLLPWYIVWTLPVAFLLPRVPRRATVALSVLLALSEVVAEPANSPRIYEGMLIAVHYVITVGVFAVLVWLLVDLRRRLRSGAPLESASAAAEQVRDEVAAEAGNR